MKPRAMALATRILAPKRIFGVTPEALFGSGT
jgi:hypothetical protein